MHIIPEIDKRKKMTGHTHVKTEMLTKNLFFFLLLSTNKNDLEVTTSLLPYTTNIPPTPHTQEKMFPLPSFFRVVVTCIFLFLSHGHASRKDHSLDHATFRKTRREHRHISSALQ